MRMPLVPPYIAGLRPYEAGKSIEEVRRQYGLAHISKLASNENPLGPSPLAREAATRALHALNYYPNGGLDLRRVLASQYGLKVENVIAGSGSEGIMANIVRAFLCDEDEVLTTEAAFIGFQVLARSRGVLYRTVPYRAWHYDLEALSAAINEHTKIVYLANPNNPTGTIFTRQEFDAFYRHVPDRVLIILDEAYFEYAKDNPRYPDSMHYRYDNVITLRTFSKIYGLAGIRIGYGFAHEDLIANLLKVKLPFEPSHAGTGGGHRRARRQGVSAPVARVERARVGLDPADAGRGRYCGGAFGGELHHGRPGFGGGRKPVVPAPARTGRNRPAAGRVRAAALPPYLHGNG